jgi:hypothetical protein
MNNDGTLDGELAACYSASPTPSGLPPLPDMAQNAAADELAQPQSFFTGAGAGLESVVIAMEAELDGLDMKDVNSCFSFSKKCFTGKKLVDWLQTPVGLAAWKLAALSAEASVQRALDGPSCQYIISAVCEPMMAAHLIHAARGLSKLSCMPACGFCCCGCCNCSMCCLKPAGHDVYEPSLESNFSETKVYQLQVCQCHLYPIADVRRPCCVWFECACVWFECAYSRRFWPSFNLIQHRHMHTLAV